jgi:ATP-binding cassette subfamily C protein CydC
MNMITTGRGLSRAALISAAGLTLAVLAEACSVGLLGLSGWFIASSAVAGASAYSLFSVLNPSGGVRAFAVGRIAAGYASRLVLHSAALRRISAARLAFYDGAAPNSGMHGKWSGQSLDRVMADADSTGMSLIQATAPMVVAAAMTAGGCLVIALAGYPPIAAIVAVAAAASAVLAAAAARRTGDPARARGALRTELVTAVGAWPEMASLGAAGQLAQRTAQRLAAFEGGQFRQAAAQARTAGAARAVTAAALLLTVVLAAHNDASVSTLVFLALLAVGVLGSAERLTAAAQARALARQARERLQSSGQEQPHRPAPGSAFRAACGPHGLTVSGYQLPATPIRPARQIGFQAGPGQTVVVTGASGSGKSTLLDTITAALQPAPGVVTAVLAEDYVFTGTIATNIRLADPAASDAGIQDLLTTMLLDRSGLDPDTRIGTGGRDLSGGEQRRLHIARALATKPDVLVIDEPTTGLDAATAAQILAAIRRRLPYAVLVLATHDLPASPDLLGPAWTTVPLDSGPYGQLERQDSDPAKTSCAEVSLG